jgi:hypothetical protein
MHFRHCTRARGGLLLVAGLLALAVGCGPNYKTRAMVKGKVTIGGKPLTAGSVMFLGKNNLSGSSAIDKEGNYIVNDAPLGEVRITVSVPSLPPGGIARMKAGPGLAAAKETGSVNPGNPGQKISIMGDMPTHVVPIPSKYANAETSGLTYTVQSGEQTHDIPLPP